MSVNNLSAKIALFTDTHLGFTAPSTRSYTSHENYLIFEECLRLACKLGAHAILHAGDLFNQSRLSSKKVIRAIRLLRDHGISSFTNCTHTDSLSH